MAMEAGAHGGGSSPWISTDATSQVGWISNGGSQFISYIVRAHASLVDNSGYLGPAARRRRAQSVDFSARFISTKRQLRRIAKAFIMVFVGSRAGQAFGAGLATYIPKVNLRGNQPMAASEPELARLLQLCRAGRDHPARQLWAGQPVFLHSAVLALLSDDSAHAKSLHREFVCLGLISPTIHTTHAGVACKVQMIYTDRIAQALGDKGDE
jgi:hypothetical protein